MTKLLITTLNLYISIYGSTDLFIWEEGNRIFKASLDFTFSNEFEGGSIVKRQKIVYNDTLYIRVGLDRGDADRAGVAIFSLEGEAEIGNDVRSGLCMYPYGGVFCGDCGVL